MYKKYKEFKEVNSYSMRARMKVLATFESQQIELAFICILIRNSYLGQTGSHNDQNISSSSSSRTLKHGG